MEHTVPPCDLGHITAFRTAVQKHNAQAATNSLSVEGACRLMQRRPKQQRGFLEVLPQFSRLFPRHAAEVAAASFVQMQAKLESDLQAMAAHLEEKQEFADRQAGERTLIHFAVLRAVWT